jgi:AcrR family transcriptional regulator
VTDELTRPRLTARGAATRSRIVEVANELMRTRGVAATTLDDVRAASNTSKSQFYQHFADKNALVEAVTRLRSERVLAREEQSLHRMSSFSGLQRWRNSLVALNAARGGANGCGLGSLANELADTNEDARLILAEAFTRWESLIAEGLERMKQAGALKPDADPAGLATGLLAALQGGYLLSQTTKDIRPMEIALDMALAQIENEIVASR